MILMNHIFQEHPNYLKEIREATNTYHLTPVFRANKKPQNIYASLEWIIMENGELRFPEKEFVRKNTKLEPSTDDQIRKYRNLPTKEVEKEISKELPGSFDIIMDGWTRNSSHYIIHSKSLERSAKLFLEKWGYDGWRKTRGSSIPWWNRCYFSKWCAPIPRWPGPAHGKIDYYSRVRKLILIPMGPKDCSPEID